MKHVSLGYFIIILFDVFDVLRVHREVREGNISFLFLIIKLQNKNIIDFLEILKNFEKND